MSSKQLNCRQARWAKYLSRRRSQDYPAENNERRLHQSQIVLKKENLERQLDVSATSLTPTAQKNSPEWKDLFEMGYQNDPFPNKILGLLRNNVKHSKEISLAECTQFENKLVYRNKWYVPHYDPIKLHILKRYHNNPSAGHPGREKTFELISRDYHWPLMRKYIARYVRNCHICQRSKPSNHTKFGILRPLPIAQQPWQEVSMDFVTGLPVSDGFDAVMVVVDRLTKMRHLIPCNTTTSAQDVARLYLCNIWKLHGLPTHVTLDCGTQFTDRKSTRLNSSHAD